MLPVQSPIQGSMTMAMDSSLPDGSAQSGGKTVSLWEMEESKPILIGIANLTQISTFYLMWFSLVPWEISQTHFSWKTTSKIVESSHWLTITLSTRLWHSVPNPVLSWTPLQMVTPPPRWLLPWADKKPSEITDTLDFYFLRLLLIFLLILTSLPTV